MLASWGAQARLDNKNCCTSCLWPFTDEQPAAAPLSYELDGFEKDFLHYSAESCCGACAKTLCYLREVAYEGEKTGVWETIHDSAVQANAEVIREHARAQTTYFEKEQQEEDERDEAFKKSDKKETEKLKLAQQKIDIDGSSGDDDSSDEEADTSAFRGKR